MSNNQDNQDTFYSIPRWIRKLPGMTLQKLDFIETIWQFLNKGKFCNLHNSTIKERTGIKSDGHLNEYFNYFEDLNVIKRVDHEDGKRYIEQVTSMVGIDKQSNIYPHGSPQPERGGLPTGSLRVSPEGDHNRSNNNRSNIKSIQRPFNKQQLEIKTLVASKLGNDTLFPKQADELLRMCGNIKNIEIALMNCIIKLAKPRKGRPIGNKLGYFIKSVQNNHGYFPDSDNNDKAKKADEEQEKKVRENLRRGDSQAYNPWNANVY